MDCINVNKLNVILYYEKKWGSFQKNAHTKLKNVRGKKHHMIYHKSKSK